MQKKYLDFGDLDSIFKVTGQRMLKNALSVLYLLRDGWILTKPAHICFRDVKELLDFGGHYPIFKVTEGHRKL